MDREDMQTENYPSCSVCNGEFRDPRTLSCRHTFCGGCLTESPKTRQAVSIVCPTCREVTKVHSDNQTCHEVTKVHNDSQTCHEVTKGPNDSQTCREMTEVPNDSQPIEEAIKQVMLSNTIYMKTSGDIATQADPDDCVVLVTDDTEVFIVTDYINESVKAFYTKGDNLCLSVLKLTHRPHCVSVLKQDQVVLSYYGEDKFTVVKVAPELHHVRDIWTRREYTCMVVLSPGRLAAGCNNPSSIDTLNLSGKILTSVSDERLIQTPRSMCTTKEGNILVTDAGTKSVYCLAPEGRVVFQYKPVRERVLHWPRGIAVTETGNILLADNQTNKITQLDETGDFVQDILTSEDITSPHGICVHDNKLYVTQVETNVKVFDLLTL